MAYFSKLSTNLHHKPLLRGMLTYSLTWPISSLIQQSFENKDYDFSRVVKFGLYGSLYVAPTLYGWMKLSCFIWPKNNLKYALIKSFVEQATYSPFAMSSFFFFLTIFEGGSFNDGCNEVSKKLFLTWKVSICVWPFIQTVNYTLIPEKNRIPFIGFCSLIWTVFLAFMKYKQNLHKENTVK